MFATGIMIKNQKVKNTKDIIKQINKLYLHLGFKITHIYCDSEFETLWEEMADLGISLNYESKKEHFPNIEQFNSNVN